MTPFARTFALLLADRGGSAWTLMGAVAVLAAWLGWVAWAQVSLYEISSDTRLELESAAYPIASPFLGRVVQADLRIGRPVRRGELLVEIDTTPQQLQLRQRLAEERGLGPQLTRLRAQISAERAAQNEERQSSRLGTEEAASRAHEAELAAQYAESEATRLRDLRSQGLISVRDLEKAETEASMQRAAAAAGATAEHRLSQEQVTRDRERRVRLERLEGEIAALASQQATQQAEIERLEYEIERRRIRAPVDGRIAEAAKLHVGAVVDEAEKLGAIVPSGRLLVVAQYPAEAAFGRIRAGQRARLRLQAFPWAEYGVVAATVIDVAQEIRDGKVRVELAVDADSDFRGRLEHGMPGTIEVTVERLSPLSLVLRTAGQWLTAHS